MKTFLKWLLPSLIILTTGLIFSTTPESNFYAPKIFCLRTFVMVGFIFWAFQLLKTSKIAAVKNIACAPAIFFAPILFWSAAGTSVPLLGQTKTIEYVVWLMFLFLVWLLNPDFRDLELSVTFVEISSALIVLYGFVQHFGLDPIHWSPGGKRIFSTIGNSDQFATFLSVLMGFSLMRFVRKPALPRFFLLEAELAALFWSYTRAPFLALLVAGALFIGMRPSFRSAKNTLFIGISLAATFFILFQFSHPSAEKERFVPTMWKGTTDFVGRSYLFEKGMEVLASSPWKGVGPGNFSFAYLRYRNNDPPFYRTRLAMGESTHNTYLDAFDETGLPGGLAFLAIWIAAFLQLCSGMRKDDSDETFLRLTLLFPLLVAFVSLQFVYPDPAMVAVTGFLIGASAFFKKETMVANLTKTTSYALFLVIMIFLLFTGVHAFRIAFSDVCYGTGEREMRLQDYPYSIREFRMAIAWNPWNPVLCQQIGKAYEAAGEPGQALKYYSRAILSQPSNPYFCADLGRLAGERHWKNLALKAYAQAVALDPYNPIFYHDAALAASSLNLFSLALFYGRETYRLNPDDPGNSYIVAFNLLKTGKKKEALIFLRKELQRFSGAERADLLKLEKEIKPPSGDAVPDLPPN